MEHITRPRALAAALAIAVAIVPVSVPPAQASWTRTSLISPVSAGCTATAAYADSAMDSTGTVRSFATWYGGSCTSARIRYISQWGRTAGSALSPYYGAVLAVADDGATTWVLYRASDGTRVGGRTRSGAFRSTVRVTTHRSSSGDIAAIGGKWWAVWSEASGALASIYNARTFGGTTTRTRITTLAATDTHPALSIRSTGVAFLTFARRIQSTGRREIALFRKATPSTPWSARYQTSDGDNHEPDVLAASDTSVSVVWRHGSRIAMLTNRTGPFVRRTFTTPGSRPRIAGSAGRYAYAWTKAGSPSEVVLAERSGNVTVERTVTTGATASRRAAAVVSRDGNAAVSVLTNYSLKLVRQTRPSITSFRGLGTWVDRLDYALDPEATVAAMKARGVRTLYLQTGKFDQTDDVIEAAKVGRWLEAAHASGIKVVGWYFPGYGGWFERDVRRTLAIKSFRSPAGHAFDAMGIDIERRGAETTSTFNADVAEHLRRVRAGVGSAYPVSAIVQSPVAMKLAPSTWAGFPWATIGRYADVVQPMGYWTFRSDCSTNPSHCPYGYSKGNVQLARAYTGLPAHEVGGIHTEPAGRVVTDQDVRDFVRGTLDAGAIGGSMYDYRTTLASYWDDLAPLN